jgi:hypothetical protein
MCASMCSLRWKRRSTHIPISVALMSGRSGRMSPATRPPSAPEIAVCRKEPLPMELINREPGSARRPWSAIRTKPPLVAPTTIAAQERKECVDNPAKMTAPSSKHATTPLKMRSTPRSKRESGPNGESASDGGIKMSRSSRVGSDPARRTAQTGSHGEAGVSGLTSAHKLRSAAHVRQ